MKTRIIIGCLAAMVAAVSCTKEIAEIDSGNKSEQIEPAAQIQVSFVGYALNTKISIGEKNGTSYPGIWQEGDALDVYDATAGTKLGTASLQASSIGQTTGTFDFSTPVSAGAKLRLVYPSGADASALTINDSPVVTIGDKSLAGKTYAYSDELTATETPIEFSLCHVPAIVKVSLSSSDFTGYAFNKLQIYSKGNSIAGAYSSAFGPAIAGSGAKDLITVTASTATTIAADAKELWFMALPATLSEVYVIAYLQKTLTNKSVEKITIPVRFKNVSFIGGQVNSIPLNGLTLASNSCSWYNPVETRELLSGVAGAGYAYGTQNTVFIEKQKNASYVSSVEIDARASGEFTKVSQPKTCQILIDGAGMDRPGSFYLDDTTVSDDGKIVVKGLNGGNFVTKDTWGTVAVKDESGNILWSFMVQGIFPDDDPVVNIDYGNFKLMDRNLGSTFSNSFMAAHKSDYTVKGSRMAWDTQCAYFQWGRKDPFPFSQMECSVESTKPADVSAAIKNPTKLYTGDNGGNSWTSSNINYNMWGTDNHKTIFDPCPKGYKVPTINIFAYVGENYVKDEAELNMRIRNIAVTLPGGSKDFWPYTGALWGNTSGTWSTTSKRAQSTNSGSLTDAGFFYWSAGASKGKGKAFFGFYNGSDVWQGDPSNVIDATSYQAMAVRCMVDTENL